MHWFGVSSRNARARGVNAPPVLLVLEGREQSGHGAFRSDRAQGLGGAAAHISLRVLERLDQGWHGGLRFGGVFCWAFSSAWGALSGVIGRS